MKTITTLALALLLTTAAVAGSDFHLQVASGRVDSDADAIDEDQEYAVSFDWQHETAPASLVLQVRRITEGAAENMEYALGFRKTWWLHKRYGATRRINPSIAAGFSAIQEEIEALEEIPGRASPTASTYECTGCEEPPPAPPKPQTITIHDEDTTLGAWAEIGLNVRLGPVTLGGYARHSRTLDELELAGHAVDLNTTTYGIQAGVRF